MPIRVAGIQPGYLPWLGYLDQMRRVDAFIVADEMQFSSSGWTHRNRVRGPHGAHWLALPARPAHGQRICDVTLDPSVPWARKHLTTLRHFYRRSPFAGELLESLARVLVGAATRMVDASLPVLRFLAERFGITTPLVISSALGLEERYRARFPEQPGPTHRIIAFMEALGARHLLEGESGRTYLDVPLCEAHGIQVEFQHYAHPTYRQLHEPFISHLSAIDLLLCAGEAEARRVLEGAR
jgi:hypothetical protein